MKHVFVETTWLVEYGAPVHLGPSTALALAQRAEAGDLRLYLPSVCLTEARHPIRRKFNPRPAADSVRSYLDWASRRGKLKPEDSATIRRLLDGYEAAVLADLDRLEERFALLRSHPGVEVFPLSDEMLVRAVDLSEENLDLEPFDQAILAAVLVRAQALRNLGADDISFCELDGHLRPWDRTGRAKQPLAGLYDAAGVWVYGDFAMENPPKRPRSPEQ
jgi:hypothetical protein